MKQFLMTTAALSLAGLLAACGGTEKAEASKEEPKMEESSSSDDMMSDAPVDTGSTEAPASRSLEDILAAQPDETKARYQYRNPQATLEFVGVEPGMRVVEVLPGGGWYSKILLPYLGEDGMLVGVDYPVEMWKLFGGFATEEFLENRKSWVQTWTAQAQEWRSEGDAAVAAGVVGATPEEAYGTVDVILAIRAMHHFSRFEDQGGYMTLAIEEFNKALKPGGIVGIVQHRAPEGNDDAWANGDNGYLKQSAVIAAFEAAGFELVETSEINANPKDQPTNEDIVWRLPPSLGTSREDEALKAQMMEIGESDRMTLKFRKPA